MVTNAKSSVLPALGYFAMGNFMATVMSISIALFRGNTGILAVVSLCALCVYFSLVALAPYKDGVEIGKANSKSKGGAKLNRSKQWLLVGFLMFGIMLALTLMYHFVEGFNVGVYRLIAGAIHPLSYLLVEGTGEFWDVPGYGEMEIMRIVPWATYVFVGIYALSVPACYIGYRLGLKRGLEL